MNTFFYSYIGFWSIACLVAVAIFVRHRTSFAIAQQPYWRFLAAPWKLATFAVAAAGIILIAPYTGDPTWDYVDAAFMSVMTFTTAPWVAGVFYQWARREVAFSQAYVAFCLWMFSASWSYDIYLVWRDGEYPTTWLPNIFASSVLYWSAGLLWNLEHRPGRGVIFAFMRPGWPSPVHEARFGALIWFALPFMMLAAAAVLSFVIPGWQWTVQ